MNVKTYYLNTSDTNSVIKGNQKHDKSGKTNESDRQTNKQVDAQMDHIHAFTKSKFQLLEKILKHTYAS